MKKIIIIALINLFYTNVYTQNYIEGFIKDKITEKSVPFTNITYLDVNIGTMSDENGYFKLKKIDSLSAIQISCLGYETLIINTDSVDKGIHLIPKTDMLDEVILLAEKPKYLRNINLGLKQTLKARTSLPFGYEFSAFIENSYNKKGIIKEVILNLNKTDQYDFIATYNIKFYNYDSINNQPGELLYHENVFVKPENKTYKLKINVENLNIKLPKNGICIGIELVNLENHKTSSMSKIAPQINFTHTEQRNITWARFMNKKWTLHTHKSRAKKGQYINANINITAIIEK